MKINYQRMVGCARAMGVIRKHLKTQELVNKGLREQITAAWGDRTRDPELRLLHSMLADGKKDVRAYQATLHELKLARSIYNSNYDSIKRTMAEILAEQEELAN